MDVYNHANGLMPIILGDIICLPMTLRAAIDLKVFEIIADAGPGAMLSPSEMVAKMPTSNPHAATSLERILRVLVTDRILTMSARSDGKGGVPGHLYGLTDRSRFLVPDKDGVTAAPIARLFLDRVTMEGLFYLKDAVIEGGRTPFEMAHGVDLFGFGSKEPRYNNVFQEGMSNGSVIAMKEIFKVYKGFNEVKQLMDVGGGRGTCISSIVSHFPHIHGSNFDLPHVIESAPHCPGVEQVGGDMFEGVPSAETIFMKFVLHDWDDDHCVKLLKNCWNALPDGGKVINVEHVVPSILGIDVISRQTAIEDLLMMAFSPSGKERTEAEYDNLAKAAGFAETNNIPISLGIHVIEFYKRISLKN